MPKHAVFACLFVIALVSGGVVTGCTTRAGEDVDAFMMVIPVPDASHTDAGPPAMDANHDAFASPDTGGSMCGAMNLHSDVGAAVATGSTTTGTDRHSPACADGGSPDVWFSWTAPAAGNYAFDLGGSSFDTVLDILSGCTGSSLACNDDGSVGSTSLATATLGLHQTVIIVVDGFGGDSGAFTLAIHAVAPEICTDGIDNDGDGNIDCADSDCHSLPMCIETNCSDGVDNDMDGSTDCADDDCFGMPACTETLCADGLDNDGDGDIDCFDTDCETSSDCDESMKCSDHVDNDLDGDVDCADSDCAADATCMIPETDCNDGIDDDDDDLIDCADPDCAAFCMENTDALCMNALDDDTDGLVDCDDLQCSCSLACPPIVPPSMTCPDMDIGTAIGNGVFHGTITPYGCGARSDSSCGTGGLGGEIEIAFKAPSDGLYIFDTNDTSHTGGVFDTIVSVRNDCTIGGTGELDCDDDGGTGHLSEAFADLVTDQEVIIVIDAAHVWDGGNVTLNISVF